MEPISIIIGIGIVSFVMVYLGIKLSDEHSLLKIMLLLFSFVLLILVPATITNQSSNCEVVLSNTSDVYKYGDDYSDYHWDYASPSPSVNDINLFHRTTTYEYTEYCGEANPVGKTFLRTYLGIYFLIMMYALYYLVWYVFKKFKTRK